MHKKYFILDFDGCLFVHPDGLEDQFKVAYAKTAIELGCPLTLEEAVLLARQSYEERGLSHYLFEPYGIDVREMYHRVHIRLFNDYVMQYKEELNQRQLRRYFEKDHVEAMILTHGTRQWAEDVLGLLNLSDLFPKNRIVGLDDTDFEKKCSSKKPYEMALQALGLDNKAANDAEVYFADDTLINHPIPHSLGIHTVFIQLSHRKPLPEKPAYVSTVSDCLWQFMDQVS